MRTTLDTHHLRPRTSPERPSDLGCARQSAARRGLQHQSVALRAGRSTPEDIKFNAGAGDGIAIIRMTKVNREETRYLACYTLELAARQSGMARLMKARKESIKP